MEMEEKISNLEQIVSDNQLELQDLKRELKDTKIIYNLLIDILEDKVNSIKADKRYDMESLINKIDGAADKVNKAVTAMSLIIR